jgi:hypothetical protein
MKILGWNVSGARTEAEELLETTIAYREELRYEIDHYRMSGQLGAMRKAATELRKVNETIRKLKERNIGGTRQNPSVHAADARMVAFQQHFAKVLDLHGLRTKSTRFHVPTTHTFALDVSNIRAKGSRNTAEDIIVMDAWRNGYEVTQVTRTRPGPEGPVFDVRLVR